MTRLAIVGMALRVTGGADRASFASALFTGARAARPLAPDPDLRRALLRVLNDALLDAEVVAGPSVAVIGLGGAAVGEMIAERVELCFVPAKGDGAGLARTVPAALACAADLIAGGHVTAVALVAGSEGGEAAAIVVVDEGHAAARAPGAYAWLGSTAESIGGQGEGDPSLCAAREAMATAAVDALSVGLLELAFDAVAPETFDALAEAHRTKNVTPPTAIDLLGRSGSVAEISALIAAALAIHHRSIVSSVSLPAPENKKHERSFYSPPRAVPWFATPAHPLRVAATHAREVRRARHCIVTQPAHGERRPPDYFPSRGVRVIPLGGETHDEILRALDGLEGFAAEGLPLDWVVGPLVEKAPLAASFRVALVCTEAELAAEVALAKRSLPASLAAGREWKTPRGSCFVPRPLGGPGRVAFVYPGAFSSYPQLASDALRLFPRAWDAFEAICRDPGHAFASSLLYPRTWGAPNKEELAALDVALAAEPVAAMRASIAASVLYTHIVRDALGVTPDFAFGYSLGEASMLWALGAWTGADEGLARLDASPLFRSRLAGERQAIGDFLQRSNLPPETRWASYTVLAPSDVVARELASARCLFAAVINTPDEVVLTGDADECARLLARTGWQAVALPFGQLLHCPVSASEIDLLRAINTHATRAVPHTAFYTAARYDRLPLGTDPIADDLARMGCGPLDFPRLVEKLHGDGARVFIELGAGAMSTRLITSILDGRDAVAVAVNRRSADDETSIVKLAALLFAHGVSVNLAALQPR